MNAKLVEIAESILSEYYHVFYRDNARILNMIEDYDEAMILDLLKGLRDLIGENAKYESACKHLDAASKSYEKTMKPKA